MTEPQLSAWVMIAGVAGLLVFGLWPRAQKLGGPQKYSDGARRSDFADEGTGAPFVDLGALSSGDDSAGDGR